MRSSFELFIFIGVSYKRLDRYSCSINYNRVDNILEAKGECQLDKKCRGIFNSLHEAKEKCFYDNQCKGVYEPECGAWLVLEEGPFIQLCTAGYDYSLASTDSCVYDKTGKAVSILIRAFSRFYFCGIKRIFFILHTFSQFRTRL